MNLRQFYYSILPLYRSRDILSRLTDAPLDNASFPSGTHQLIQVAGHTVRALRVSFVGRFFLFLLDLIRTRLDFIRTRLDLIRSRLDLIRRYGRAFTSHVSVSKSVLPVADADQGSWIRCFFYPWIRIRDKFLRIPGSRTPDPGSNPDF
jgi:hypothetical protein